MNDIVETIQSEQDAIIRSEHKSVLVVQGGPGTGKTAVALHRAAYLLYTYRQQLAKSGVLIIGPNATFLDYIGQVLPSLGETGVLLSTIGDLYPGVQAVREDSLRAGEIKGSLDMLEVLKQAVRDRQEVPSEPVRLAFDGYPVILDRKIATRARGRARSSRRPHNLARPIFASSVIDALTDQLGRDHGRRSVRRHEPAQLRRPQPKSATRCAPTRTCRPRSARCGRCCRPSDVLADLLADPARLDRAAKTLSARIAPSWCVPTTACSARPTPRCSTSWPNCSASTTPRNANARVADGGPRSRRPRTPWTSSPVPHHRTSRTNSIPRS